MEYTRTPLIIVGIECNHSPNHGRLQEYSPHDFTLPKEGKITGKGKITMDWLTHTFKPYIDTHYRTLSDREHTFIAGSSMGGLMSIMHCSIIISSFPALQHSHRPCGSHQMTSCR